MSRYKLVAGEGGLALALADRFGSQSPLRLAFDRPGFLRRLRLASGKTELLVKAVQPKAGLAVLDCTGGLGRDAMLLAYLGCEVTVCERSPTIHALLEDALARARQHPDLGKAAARISLLFTDAIDALQALGSAPEVIYMDPMFPPRRKDARVKGEMQFLQRFLGEDRDFPRLFAAAQAQPGKLVVKLPARGATAIDWQPPVKPSHTLESRRARYAIFHR